MKHLNLVKENYFRHMLEAWLISATLIGASLICFLHSIFPFMFQSTASNMLKTIINRTDKRKNSHE